MGFFTWLESLFGLGAGATNGKDPASHVGISQRTIIDAHLLPPNTTAGVYPAGLPGFNGPDPVRDQYRSILERDPSQAEREYVHAHDWDKDPNFSALRSALSAAQWSDSHGRLGHPSISEINNMSLVDQASASWNKWGPGGTDESPLWKAETKLIKSIK